MLSKEQRKTLFTMQARIAGFDFQNNDHAGLIRMMGRGSSDGSGTIELKGKVHHFISDLNLNSNVRVDLMINEGVEFVVGPYSSPRLLYVGRHNQTVSTMKAMALRVSYDIARVAPLEATFYSKQDVIQLLMMFRTVSEGAGFGKNYIALPDALANVGNVSDIDELCDLDVSYIVQQVRLFIADLPARVKLKVMFSISSPSDPKNGMDPMMMYIGVFDPEVDNDAGSPSITVIIGSATTESEKAGRLAHERASQVLTPEYIAAALGNFKYPETRTNLDEAKKFMETHRGTANYNIVVLSVVNKHYSGKNVGDPEVVEFLEALGREVPAW